jgi:multidrug efflux system membrane fusion protein
MIGVSGAVLVAGMTGCHKGNNAPPPQRPPAMVQTAPAVQTNAPVVIEAFGYTEDRVSVDVVPQVSGTLLKTLIGDGAIVTNGQPLFLIDPGDYAARVRQMEGVVRADRANLDLHRSTMERNQSLFEKKLVSTEVFDAMKARVEATTGQLQMDEAALELARLNLARCTVTAVVSGICSKRYVDDGNLVAAGVTRLTNIRSYDPMDVEFSVSDQYLPVLRQAMAAGEVRLEVCARGTTERVGGVLTFIDNAVNAQSGTILLRGQAPNPDQKLWAKQFVNVTVYAGEVKGAVLVPEGAVQIGKQGAYVYVAKEGKAEMRPVRTGMRVGSGIQVLSGVDAGERVVLLGQMMLFPGAPVMDAALAGAAGGPGAAMAGGK